MNYSHCPLTRAFLEAANKRFIIELKRTPDVSIEQLKKLKPVRDIDEKIISYSPNPHPHSEPTQYEDCFERMTFEHEPEVVDCWRNNELYQRGNEYKGYISESYSTDDVPLADSLIKKHLGLRERISREHYPETYLSHNDKCTLKLIEFEENIVPSSFDPKLKVEWNTIRDFAKESTAAWGNGVPTNQIIRMLEKSVIKKLDIENSYPDIDLFKFLIIYPNKRPLVVVKSNNGEEEFFDKSAALYYKIFERKLFADANTAQKVLEECKTYDNCEVPTVSNKLGEIACLLRRRSALGLPEKIRQGYYNLKVQYCDNTTPWGSKETELLNRIKPNGHLDEEYYSIAKMMLRDDKTIDFVLENIDENVKREKAIKGISQKYAEEYISSYKLERTRIEELLRLEYLNDTKLPQENNASGVILESVKAMQEEGMPIRATLKIAQIMESMKNDGITDFKYLKKIVKLVNKQETLYNTNIEDLISLSKKLYKETKHFGANETRIMEKVCKGALQDDWSQYLALEYILDELKAYYKAPKMSKIAFANFDELAKYIRRYTPLMATSKEFKKHSSYLLYLIHSELQSFMTKEKIMADECKMLKLVEDFCAKTISYDELLNQVKILQTPQIVS